MIRSWIELMLQNSIKWRHDIKSNLDLQLKLYHCSVSQASLDEHFCSMWRNVGFNHCQLVKCGKVRTDKRIVCLLTSFWSPSNFFMNFSSCFHHSDESKEWKIPSTLTRSRSKALLLWRLWLQLPNLDLFLKHILSLE